MFKKIFYASALIAVLLCKPLFAHSVWIIDDGEKILRNATSTEFEQGIDNPIWAPGQPIKLFALKNETVAFQVVVEAEGANLSSVTVDLNVLNGPGGAIIQNTSSDPGQFVGRYIERFVEHFFHIDRESGGPWNGESLGWASGSGPNGAYANAWVPDALIPVEIAPSWSPYPLSINANENGIVWIDITVPQNQTAGTYTGNVVVKNNGTTLSTINIELTVYDYTLPDWPQKNMFFYHREELERRIGGDYGVDITAAEKQLWQLFHRHRLTPFYTVDDASYVDRIRDRLNGQIYTNSQGYDGPAIGRGDDMLSIGTYGGLGQPNSSSLATVEAIADKLAQENLLYNRDIFVYALDEDCSSSWGADWENLLTNSSDPNVSYIQSAWTCSEDPSNSPVDIPIVSATGSYDTLQVRTARNAGKKVWIYNGEQPFAGTYATDVQAVATRVNSWIQEYYGIERWFYWETTFWYDDNPGGWGAYDPFVESETYHNSYGEWMNGDGVLVYPGKQTDQFTGHSIGYDGVIPSIRLKNIRRGIQDAGYYQLAKSIDPAASKNILSNIVDPSVKYATGGNPPTWPLKGKDFFNARQSLLNIFTGQQAGIPAAPSGLTANAVSSSQIDLHWTDNANDENGFKVEHSPDGNNWSQIASVGSNVTSYSHTGLSAQTTHYYRVYAYNANGNSNYSNTASATTQNGGGSGAGGPYRYLRLKIINNLGNPSEVEFYDIAWLEGSAIYDVGYFWGDPANLPINVDKDFGQGAAITPTSIRFQNGYDKTHQAESFECYGSNDNQNWELFYSKSGLTTNDWGTESSYTSFTISAGNSNTPPTVALTAPADNAVFSEPADITITADASDSDGSIAKVEFFQGSTKLGEDTSAPYSITWNGVTQGDYTLTAKATDNDGASTTSSAVNISVGASTTGGPYRYLRLKIINNLGNPSEVEFYDIAWLEGSAVYDVGYFWGDAANLPIDIDKDLGQDVAITPTSIRFQNGYDKTHQAESFECYGSNDNQNWELFYSKSGLTTNDWGSENSYTTFNISPPSVTITEPANNAVFSEPADITTTADASDSDGSIAKVEFFQGSTKLGEDTSAPYSITWNGVTQGDYTLTAKATDNDGASTTSSAVNISVGASTTGGPYRYLRLKIINNLGNPSEVEFYDIAWLEGSAVYDVGYFWGDAANLPIDIDKDLGQDVAITPTSIRFQNGYDKTHQAESFECYGSNDNQNWELFYSKSGLTTNDWGTENSYTSFTISSLNKSHPDKKEVVKPTSYKLEQNFPNPFNPETNIRYYLKANGYVNLTVYNLLGQEVKILVSDFRNSGVYNAVWHGVDQTGHIVPSGIYIYRIEIKSAKGTFTDIRKMLLMK